ncbi:uncharacterized protein LOC143459831 isoform X1 [Clavelina lepadiformis]|uniref:uncharacterized protein LOC143459831 isoform X1 n=1 Tax=Clavelina lepadiformis TaxID=159417 RepID=UPI0040424CA7
MICTMYCTNCGKVLSSTHLFCGFCGQEKPHSSIETQNFCDETSSKENGSNCHDNLMDNKSNASFWDNEKLQHYKGIHCFLNLFLSHRLSVLLMQIMLQVC